MANVGGQPLQQSQQTFSYMVPADQTFTQQPSVLGGGDATALLMPFAAQPSSTWQANTDWASIPQGYVSMATSPAAGHVAGHVAGHAAGHAAGYVTSTTAPAFKIVNPFTNEVLNKTALAAPRIAEATNGSSQAQAQLKPTASSSLNVHALPFVPTITGAVAAARPPVNPISLDCPISGLTDMELPKLDPVGQTGAFISNLPPPPPLSTKPSMPSRAFASAVMASCPIEAPVQTAGSVLVTSPTTPSSPTLVQLSATASQVAQFALESPAVSRTVSPNMSPTLGASPAPSF